MTAKHNKKNYFGGKITQEATQFLVWSHAHPWSKEIQWFSVQGSSIWILLFLASLSFVKKEVSMQLWFLFCNFISRKSDYTPVLWNPSQGSLGVRASLNATRTTDLRDVNPIECRRRRAVLGKTSTSRLPAPSFSPFLFSWPFFPPETWSLKSNRISSTSEPGPLNSPHR